MSHNTPPVANTLPDSSTEAQQIVGQSRRDFTGPYVSEAWVIEQIATAKKEVIEDAEKAIREQVQTDKASLITVFGIFASVVSFLTIEFQFLKTLCSFEKILGFTLILFSLLFSFNIALDYLVKSRLDKQTPKPNVYFVIFVVLVFVTGIYITFQGNEEVCRDNKIYQRYSDQFEESSNEQQKRLDYFNLKLRSLEKQINSLNIK